MEAKINIAEILRDKPVNTKLYSPLFGDVYFSHVKDSIINVKHHAGESKFLNSGRYYNYVESEPLLFPSKEMRDWSKFAWKKGDILVRNDNDSHIIFEGFSKDDYTTFEGKHWISVSEKRRISYLEMQKTQIYHIEDDKDAAQTYINTIENYAWLNGSIPTIIESSHPKSDIYAVRLSTEQEKQKLFDALAKDGKAWDTEKKQIVDLKPKVELKPFDKVLVRDGKNEIWEPAFFFRNLSHLNVYNYQTVGGELRVYCIPFNEETAKLIGTTDDWEG